MPHALSLLRSECAARGSASVLVLALFVAACSLDVAGRESNLGAGGGSSMSTGGSGGGGGSEPVCGNSVTETGEGCDDGNALPGDRCSPACEREEPDDCPGVPISLTTAGLTIVDNTSGMDNNTGTLPCGGAYSGDLVYEITPATNGTVKATLSGEFDPLVYARAACPGSEEVNLACASFPAIIEMNVLAQVPFYLFVDGRGGAPEEGQFTLQLELF